MVKGKNGHNSKVVLLVAPVILHSFRLNEELVMYFGIHTTLYIGKVIIDLVGEVLGSPGKIQHFCVYMPRNL